MDRRRRLDTLTALIADELVPALDLPSGRWLRPLLRPPAQGFARQLVNLDDIVAAGGFAAGARWALRTFTRDVDIDGSDRVPADGPLLVVANHPGLTDVMGVVLALGDRSELRIVAHERPLLGALPAIRSHLLEVPDGDRSELIRRARQHLRGGGVLLSFPAGVIEPDPTVRPANDSLPGWSRSVTVLTRGLPDVRVLPIAVSGVISRTALGTRIVRRLPDPASREYAAATLQVLFRRYRDTDMRVQVGVPFAPGPDAPDVIRRQLEHLLGLLAES